MNANKIIVLIFLLNNYIVFGQKSISDSTYQLNEVIISSNRLSSFSAGVKIKEFDSLSLLKYNSQNLSDLLSNESSLFIKSYGNGSLSTSSFRGGSANHTAILWNGFNINSPMNGQIDLSLIPIGTVDGITVQYGGSSALWGSGAIGGTIHLNNNAKFDNGFTSKIDISNGSYSNNNQQISAEISKKKLISSIKIFNTSSKNNFQYKNNYSNENHHFTQKNAELNSTGLISENYLKINDYQQINFFLWAQKTDRNLPPTMLQENSNSNQKDNNYKITSEWKINKSKHSTYIRAGYFDESLIYFDGNSNNTYNNLSKSFISEAETKIAIHKQHTINFGINNTYISAKASGYLAIKTQNKTSLFASYIVLSKLEKIRTNLSVRQEFIENQLIPFTYSIGTDYNCTKWLSFKANVSRAYRTPTFNDLYWSPGGNINLLSESGFTEDFGIKLKIASKKEKTILTFEPTLYNRNIKNWIVWVPTSNSIWSPQNIMEVWSRGMETTSQLKTKINNTKILFSVSTNYTLSTNEKSKSENDISVGKQLIYTPIYSGNAKIEFEYKNFILSYNHNYTGYRYTSTDNSEYLNPYDLGSFYVSLKKQLKNFNTSIYFQINNFWNKNYQIISYRAMPEMNFNLGVSLKVKSRK